MRAHTRIIEATRDLIGTKGFDAVTIAAVAERALDNIVRRDVGPII